MANQAQVISSCSCLAFCACSAASSCNLTLAFSATSPINASSRILSDIARLQGLAAAGQMQLGSRLTCWFLRQNGNEIDTQKNIDEAIWSLLFFASHFTCPTAQHQCQHKYFWPTNAKMIHAVARFMVCRSHCKLFTSSNLLGSFGRSCANHVEALDLFRHGPVRLVRYVRCWLLPVLGYWL